MSNENDERFPGIDDEPDFDPIFSGEGRAYPVIQEPEDRERTLDAQGLRIVNVKQGDTANTGNSGQMVNLVGSGNPLDSTPFTAAFEYPRNPPGKASPRLVQVRPTRITTVDPAGASIDDVFVEVLITWGNDGARQSRTFPAMGYLRVPLVCDRVEVSLRLRMRDGSTVSPSISAVVAAFVAPGVDGEYPVPNLWQDMRSVAHGLLHIKDRAARMLRVKGLSSTPDAIHYILLFDQVSAPVNNDPAVDGVRPDTENFDFNYENTRGFVNGVWLAVSTTYPLLTLVDTSTCAVTDEEAL